MVRGSPLSAIITCKELPDPKHEEDCYAEPETSTDEAEEIDGTFDAVTMHTRVLNPHGDLEEHEHPCPM